MGVLVQQPAVIRAGLAGCVTFVIVKNLLAFSYVEAETAEIGFR